MTSGDLERGTKNRGNSSNFPSYYVETAEKQWTSWLIPMFVVANIVVFIVVMYVNDCPKKNLGSERSCVAKFLGRFSFQPLKENPLFGPSSATLEKMGALEWNKIVRGDQGWRLITCMWLHAGVIHVLANMLSLVFIGIRLEQQFGFVRVGLIYLVSGFGGSIFSSLFIQRNISVGASGALFGLLGAMLSELLTNWTIYSNKEVPAGNKDSPGGPWEFVGLLPLFDPPRHDSAETIRRALDLGVSVKMITGDQLAIGKETGRRLGMGTNMYPSSSLLGENKDGVGALPIDELIENADGFAGVFPEHKYEIVKRLQAKKHIVGMTGDGVNDAPALKIADIGIAVADATDAARSASDIVLTEPGLSVIISAVLTSRAIFQRMKNYTIYAVSITIRIVMGFMLLAVFWKFDFPPFMVLIIAVLNDGTIMTISKDRVKPSPIPDCWKLSEIFATGIVIGSYLAVMTVVFFWMAFKTDFFPKHFHVKSFNQHLDLSDKVLSKELNGQLASAVYLQVSTISQALIFVTRSRSWSYKERPGLLLLSAFIIAQLIATVISATATWDFAGISKIGWRWTAVIWLYNIVTYKLLDPIKFAVRYAQSGRAWSLVYNQRTAMTTQKDFGKEARKAAWAAEQRTLHGLQSMEAKSFSEKHTFRDINIMAEEARRRAEIARLRELHTLKGKVESIAKLRGLDIDVNPHYTV